MGSDWWEFESAEGRHVACNRHPWEKSKGALWPCKGSCTSEDDCMLQEVVIMKDRATGKSRGFGFVTFQQASDAAHAGNKEHMVDGRRCEVGTAA